MSEENNGVQPQGKQMGVAGFVLAIATLVLSSWIAAMAAASIIMGGSAWLMYVWLVLAIISVVLSAMGMSKLGKTGGKKGLAVAGLVIGIVWERTWESLSIISEQWSGNKITLARERARAHEGIPVFEIRFGKARQFVLRPCRETKDRHLKVDTTDLKTF